MKHYFVLLLFSTMIVATALAFDGFSKLVSVEPDTGKVGDSVSAKGENLDKSKIGELYLTDGKNDVKAKITEQSESEIKFTVPKIEAGRFLLILPTTKDDILIGQPVVFIVE